MNEADPKYFDDNSTCLCLTHVIVVIDTFLCPNPFSLSEKGAKVGISILASGLMKNRFSL
jgi:hypothetical protein